MLKHFILFALLLNCLGAAPITVNAQTENAIIVPGKQPLKQSDVDRLIDFYEWAFEMMFTTDQKAKFQTLTADEYRANPKNSRAVIDDIIATLPKILAADDSLQADTRKSFLAAFLPEARKNSDESSRLLVGIYDRANGGGDAETMSSFPVNRPADLSLNGKWHRTVGSGFRDSTGKTKYKSGEDTYFEFLADGNVRFKKVLDVLTITQCTIKGGDSAAGKFTVSGDRLTISLGPLETFETNSCTPAKNFRKTLPASSSTVKFEVRKMDSMFRPDNPTILCFGGAADDACYEQIK